MSNKLNNNNSNNINQENQNQKKEIQNVIENERTRKIFEKVMIFFDSKQQELFTIKEESKILIRRLTYNLKDLADLKCQEESKLIKKYFDLKNDENYGLSYEPNDLYIINEKEANNNMNMLNRCIDKNTGVNKKIYLFHNSANQIKSRNINCIKKCEENTKEKTDDILRDCFYNCINENIEDLAKLQFEYNNDLLDILKRL
jgi:hypothetical protein